MPYMLLIIEEPAQRSTRDDAQGRAVYAQMQAFAADLERRGVLRAVESLSGTSAAARVRVQDGRPQVTDGPFAEAKEMVGGFFLVDVPTRQEALALAAQCPAAAWATVEVRATGPCHL